MVPLSRAAAAASWCKKERRRSSLWEMMDRRCRREARRIRKTEGRDSVEGSWENWGGKLIRAFRRSLLLKGRPDFWSAMRLQNFTAALALACS